MALGDPYVELHDLKDYLGIKQSKIDNDGNLESAIRSASREAEQICNRQFNRVEVATPRLYRANGPARSNFSPPGNRVIVDDFYTTDDLVVEYDSTGFGDWVTIPATDYEVYPYNGIVNGLPGWPFYQITIVSWYFPRLYNFRKQAAFRVTAKWGWEAVPADVRQAVMMLCGDTYQQKDSPYGVMSDQYGVTLRPSGPTSGVGTQARLKLSRYTRDRLLVA